MSLNLNYQVFATNTSIGQLALLEARQRARAPVEDRIKAAKETGLRRSDKRVAIGSGATTVTLVPAMAADAGTL